MSVITIGVSALVAGITTKIIATYYFKKVDGYVSRLYSLCSGHSDRRLIFMLIHTSSEEHC